MSQEQRGFDWGPPSSGSAFNATKEWIIYALLAILVGSAGWMLIEWPSRPSSSALPVTADRAEGSGEGTNQTPATAVNKPESNGTSSAAIDKKSRAVFMVQLGAFGDEESARVAYEKVKGLGFSPSISLPDEQYEMYRLLMGPFSHESEAEGMARRLNELDFPCFVIESSY